jgi:ElaB/YqjD/DUF883 family membrane-anchored ribosome-binding protein
METGNAGAAASRAASGVVETLNRGKDALGSAASDALNSASSDLQALRDDLNSLRDTMTTFMSEVSTEAMRSARDVSSAVADTGAKVASDAAQRGKSLANDLEDVARRNPLGAIAGAVMVGVLIGMMGRRR